MYKKIKNGSFMNLIWFIICVLPLCFILFSLNNEDNKTQVYQNEFNYFYSDTDLYLNDYDINEGEFIYNNLNNNILLSNEQPNYNYFLLLQAENRKTYWYYFIYKLPYKVSVFNISITSTINNITSSIIEENIDSNEYFDYIIFSFQNNFELDNNSQIPINVSISFEENEFSNDNFDLQFGLFVNENYIEKEYFEGFPNEIIIQPLNYWYNNFKSNGFISNAFLDLSKFFGVNNVYYSLACYYIEYLLVIVLLHLAFDVLYILPNVCHKFMEKIGGDRD